MARNRARQPTAAELAILEVLWEHGPSTVRDVHEILQGRGGGAAYTTTLKLLQIMTEKSLVKRDESSRSHVYRPSQDSSTTRRALVRDLIDRAFAGSTSRLVLSALSARRASREEIERIRELLDEHGQHASGTKG